MKNYLNIEYPKSNEKPGIEYHVLLEGGKILTAKTFDDLETIIQQTQWNKQTLKKAVKMDHGLPLEFVPETSQERFNREEGRERCERIAKEIEAYTEGNIFRCPECGEILQMPADVGDKFKCYHCHETNDVNSYDQLYIGDYLEDVLGIEYRCTSKKEYRSCELCIGWGGPNIYIDTADSYVKLYWGSTQEQYPLSYEARDEIDEYMEDLFDCI